MEEVFPFQIILQEDLNMAAAILGSIPENEINDKDELSKEFRYYLTCSNENEKDQMPPERIENVLQYFQNLNGQPPNIQDLYQIVFPKHKCFRESTDSYEGFVGVVKKQNKREYSFYNIGMKASDLEPNSLQQLVNKFYRNEFYPNIPREICAMICYLLYERIHPHHDGNGRIGRLLFLENTFQHVYYPISQILTNLRDPKLMQNIFDEISFPQKAKSVNNFVPLYRPKEEYYKITITDTLLKNIIKCLCVAKEYKVLYQNNVKHSVISQMLRRKLSYDKIKEMFGDVVLKQFVNSGVAIEVHNQIVEMK